MSWRNRLSDKMILNIITYEDDRYILHDIIMELYVNKSKLYLVYHAVDELQRGIGKWRPEDEKILIPILKKLFIDLREGDYTDSDRSIAISLMRLIVSFMGIHAKKKPIQDLFAEIAGFNQDEVFDYGRYYPENDLTRLMTTCAEKLRSNSKIMSAYENCGKSSEQRIIILSQLKRKTPQFWKQFANKTSDKNVWGFMVSQIKDEKMMLEVLEKIPKSGYRWSVFNAIQKAVANFSAEQINYLLMNANNWMIQKALLSLSDSFTLTKGILLKTNSIIVRQTAFARLSDFGKNTIDHDLLRHLAKTKKFNRLWDKIIPRLRKDRYELYKFMLEHEKLEEKRPWYYNDLMKKMIDNFPDDQAETDELALIIYDHSYEYGHLWTLVSAFRKMPKDADRIVKFIAQTHSRYAGHILHDEDYEVMSAFVVKQDIEYVASVMELIGLRNRDAELWTKVTAELPLEELQTLILMSENVSDTISYRKQLKIRLEN
ncbi:hypothetical protein LCGC14_0195580 [marine sediment metagenome]|uniref:Uncharacterized protein n=1 Tax=marine sediment metagenome TaxID=412755 RepID=A0A0F9UKE0_9ZZZZ